MEQVRSKFKTLFDWLPKGATIDNKRLTSYQHLKVVKEFSSAGMDFQDYILEKRANAPFVQRHVYKFCVLENGYAVGFNENPQTGWSFPIIKYQGWYATDELKHEVKVKVKIKGDIYYGHIEKRLLDQWPCKKEALFIIFDDTERPHFPYEVEKWEGKIEVLNS